MAVQFAADHSLKVSALGGGHQLAGIALPDGGVTILMYKLQYLALDPATNLTTVQASPVAGLLSVSRRGGRRLHDKSGSAYTPAMTLKMLHVDALLQLPIACKLLLIGCDTSRGVSLLPGSAPAAEQHISVLCMHYELRLLYGHNLQHAVHQLV